MAEDGGRSWNYLAGHIPGLPPIPKPDPNYVMPEHRTDPPVVKRACNWCGLPYTRGPEGHLRYCSEDCHTEAKAKLKGVREASSRPPPAPLTRPAPSRVYREPPPELPSLTALCAWCGGSFKPNGEARYCTELCEGRAQQLVDARRRHGLGGV